MAEGMQGINWATFNKGVDHQRSGNWSPPADPEETDECATCLGHLFVAPALAPPIGHPDFGKLIPCPDCYGDDGQDNRRFAGLAGLGPEHVAQSFQSFDVNMQENRGAALAILNAFGNWAAGHQPPTGWYPWLVVLSDPGTGKTHLCVAAMWRLAKRKQVSLYMDAIELGKRARSFDDGVAAALHEELTGAAWLLLDDLGNVHDPSGYVAGVIADVLDVRYRLRLPTLITSNLSMEELAQVVDRGEHGRIWDRFNDASLTDVLLLHSDLTSVRPKLGGEHASS